MGYDAKWGVLGASDVGGVHQRKRIWILATDNMCKRGERFGKKQIFRLSAFPWGKDVRGIEDLRKRPDLPQPLIRRIGNDVAFGVDRLKAIGNGQVPPVAATAWRILQ